MLHLAILRSPYAHATIKGIDTTAAQAHPKVKAVITGADLAEKGLAWMPTLSNDVQAVLATDKGARFQDRRWRSSSPRTGTRREMPWSSSTSTTNRSDPVIDVRAALDPSAPVIRTDLEGKTDNHCFDWGPATPPPPTPCSPRPMVVVKQEIVYPRASCADGDLRCRSDLDPVSGKLTLWCTTQALHAHRTVYALVAGLPEHKIRIVAPDIGGGFGNKVPIYRDTSAPSSSLVLGKPVKWMEDRSENLTSTGFAATTSWSVRSRPPREGKILGIRSTVLADHGRSTVSPRPPVPGRLRGVHRQL